MNCQEPLVQRHGHRIYAREYPGDGFHEVLPTSDLFLLPGARHYVQMDEPERVAQWILSMPLISDCDST